jgi:hypothetical protein
MKNHQTMTTQDEPLTIDVATGQPDSSPREIKLKTANDVRLEIGKVYREMRHGKIETADGTKLIYVQRREVVFIRNPDTTKPPARDSP